MAKQDAQLARCVILALVTHKPRHGWALYEELAPTGEIGRAWTLSRQLVYRAIDSLEDEALVRRAAPKDGGGADKVVVSPTALGKRVVNAWLEEPVAHLRDVRTELVVKIMLRNKFDLPLQLFIERQEQEFESLIHSIKKSATLSPIDMWRIESANAVSRYLKQVKKLGD